MPFDPAYRLPDFTRSGSIFPATTARKETPAAPLARDVRAVSSGVVRLPTTTATAATSPAMPRTQAPAAGGGATQSSAASSLPGFSIPRAKLASAALPPNASGAALQPKASAAALPAKTTAAGLSTKLGQAIQGSRGQSSTSASAKNQVYRPDVNKHPGRSNGDLNGVASRNGENLVCRHFVMGLGLDQPGKGARLPNGKPAFDRLNSKQGIEQYLSSQERLVDIKAAQKDVSLIANSSFSGFYKDRMAMMAGQPVPWTQRFALVTGPHAMYLELSAKVDDHGKSYAVLRFYDPNNSANWLSRTEIRQDRDIPSRFSDLFRPQEGSSQQRQDFSRDLLSYGFPKNLDQGHLLAYALPGGKEPVSGNRFKAFESEAIPAGSLSVAGAALCVHKGLQLPFKQTRSLVANGDTAFVNAQLANGLNAAFIEGTVPSQSLLGLIESLPLSGPGAPDWTAVIGAKNTRASPVLELLVRQGKADRLQRYTQFIDGLPAMLKKRVNWSEIQQTTRQAAARLGSWSTPEMVAAFQQFTSRLQSWSRGQ